MELIAWIALGLLCVVQAGLYLGWRREAEKRSRLQDQVLQLQRMLLRAENETATPITKNPLSLREAQVLRLARDGLPNKLIAKELGLSLYTVKNHVHNAVVKLGVHGRLEAVLKANPQGWLLTDAAEVNGNLD